MHPYINTLPQIPVASAYFSDLGPIILYIVSLAACFQYLRVSWRESAEVNTAVWSRQDYGPSGANWEGDFDSKDGWLI